MKMSQFSTNTRHRYLTIARKRLKIDGYICSKAFYKHWILFPSMLHLYRDCPRGVPWGGQMWKFVLKWLTFKLRGWITGKRLKIDGYMLRAVWQASNSLSIHVIFTAIVPGAYNQGKPKCAYRCRYNLLLTHFSAWPLNSTFLGLHRDHLVNK